MSKVYKNIQIKGFVEAKQISITGEFTLPLIDGNVGQVMSTDGFGNVSWTDPTGLIDTTTIDLFDDIDLYPTSPAQPIELGAVLTWNGSEFIPADPSSIKRSWSWSAGRNANTTNQYLRRDNDIFTNLTPYVVPFDCQLRTIVASTDGAETWTAEVRVDSGSGFTTVASLSISASDNDTDDTLNVILNAGDKVALYCNGNNISRPAIDIWLVEE